MVVAKIIKIVATRCQILRLKCTKFDVGWGSAPDPAGGAYSAPPDALAGLRGLLLREGEGRGGKGEGKEGRGREGGGERDPQGKFNKSCTGREERGRDGKKGKGSVLPQCSSVPP